MILFIVHSDITEVSAAREIERLKEDNFKILLFRGYRPSLFKPGEFIDFGDVATVRSKSIIFNFLREHKLAKERDTIVYFPGIHCIDEKLFDRKEFAGIIRFIPDGALPEQFRSRLRIRCRFLVAVFCEFLPVPILFRFLKRWKKLFLPLLVSPCSEHIVFQSKHLRRESSRENLYKQKFQSIEKILVCLPHPSTVIVKGWNYLQIVKATEFVFSHIDSDQIEYRLHPSWRLFKNELSLCNIEASFTTGLTCLEVGWRQGEIYFISLSENEAGVVSTECNIRSFSGKEIGLSTLGSIDYISAFSENKEVYSDRKLLKLYK